MSERLMDDKMGKAAQVVNTIAPAKMTLAEVRAKLDGKSGKRYWKSLDELADTPAFQELMQEEFPRQASAGEWVDSVRVVDF
jgi:MoCo/4Fe-4S cofactor protein with predicted Tat translocation signal